MKLENDPFGFAQGIYNGLLSYFDLNRIKQKTRGL